MTSSIPSPAPHRPRRPLSRATSEPSELWKPSERGCSTRTTSPTSSPSMPRATPAAGDRGPDPTGIAPHPPAGDGKRGGWKYLLPLMPRFFRNLASTSTSSCSPHHTRLRPVLPPACSTSATTRPFATRGSLRAGRPRAGSPASGCVGSGRTSGASTCAQRRTRTASWPIRRPFKADPAFLRPGLGRHPPAGRRRPVLGHCRRADGVPVGAAAGAAQAAGVVAEAFRGLPHRLTMVGEGMLEASCAPRCPRTSACSSGGAPTSSPSSRRAAGFIHIGEEDFGISMVEALAAGAPVIAVDQGGARDIVRPDVDGVLLEAPEPRALGKPWRRSPHARGTAGLWPSVPASSRASASSSGSAVTSPSSAFLVPGQECCQLVPARHVGGRRDVELQGGGSHGRRRRRLRAGT